MRACHVHALLNGLSSLHVTVHELTPNQNWATEASHDKDVIASQLVAEANAQSCRMWQV